MLAEQRRVALISYQLDLNKMREDALREGEELGVSKGLRQAVESLCDVLDTSGAATSIGHRSACGTAQLCPCAPAVAEGMSLSSATRRPLWAHRGR